MKANRVISVLFIFGSILIMNSPEIPAQNPQPAPQVSLLREDKSSPFKEGKTIIAEVQFTGLDTDDEVYGYGMENGLYESDFLRYHTNIKIIEGEKFNTEKVGALLRLLKQWLAAEGYLRADVVAYGTKLLKGRMRLTFSVDRGLPLDPPELNFVGNENISTQEFIDDFKVCSRSNWERYDFRKYQYYSKQCSLQLLFSKGFFEAKVYDIRAKLVENRYQVIFGIYEGPRYLLGEIKFRGAKEFPEKELIEMFGQNSGDVADGRNLQDFVYKKLKRAYAERGYVQFNAEFDPEIIKPKAEGLAGMVNVLITIDEGRKFSVRRIIFTGLESSEAQRVKTDFLLKEGDVFVWSKYEAAIENINNEKLFYPVDKDSNVEIRTDEEAGDLDLVIKLRKIE